MLDIRVNGDIVALKGIGIFGFDTAESTGTAAFKRSRLTCECGERFLSRLKPESNVDTVTCRNREIRVQVSFLLRITADVKTPLRDLANGADTNERQVTVDSIIEEVVEFALAVVEAEVVKHSTVELTLYAHDDTGVVLFAVQERRVSCWQPDEAV